MVVTVLGAEVRNPEGGVVGEVVRLVVEPGVRLVTHVVVRSATSTGGKLVPLGDVSGEPDGTLRLGTDISMLPDFAEIEFVPIDFGDPAHPGGEVPALAWIWPIDHPDRPWWVEASQAIHPRVEGTSLSAGTPVMAATGAQVGAVAGTFVAPDERLTHVVVRRASDGVPAAVPTRWVSHVDDAAVVLSVDRQAVDALPASSVWPTQSRVGDGKKEGDP